MKRRIYIPKGCDQQGRVQDGQWIEFDDDQPPGEPLEQKDGLWLITAVCTSIGLAGIALVWVGWL